MSVRFSHPEQYFIGIDSDIVLTHDLSVRSFGLNVVNGDETLWLGARGIFQVNRRADGSAA